MKKILCFIMAVILFEKVICADSPDGILNKACLQPPASYKSQTSAITTEDISKEGMLLTKWGAFDSRETSFLAPSGFYENFPCADQYILKFDRALTKAELEAMEKDGIKILGLIPHNGYVVSGKPDQFKNISAGFISLTFSPLLKIEPLLYKTDWPVPPILNVILAKDSRPLEIFRSVKECYPDLEFVSLFGGGEPVLRLFYPKVALRDLLRDLASRNDVIFIEPWFLPEPRNDNSIYVVQSYDTLNKTNYPVCATIWNQGITGTDETPAVCDTGLDSDMCFYRLSGSPSDVTDAQYPTLPDPGTLETGKKVIVYDVLPGATPYDGQYTCSSGYHHGTHVCGSVVGDNYSTPSTPTSGGHDSGDGMAPNAKLIFQDAGLETTGCLNGLANDWQLIFQQAYNAGARIHSDSWGSSVGGIYDGDSRAADIFSYGHEDFLLFFAAGNSGPSALTIDSPGNAKNVVAVGAAANGSAGANSLASFSGRGPCADGRLKPDIAAPGVSIASASADELHSSDNCSTRLGSGTSMATPTAAGAATLLRNYLRKGYYPTGAANSTDRIIPSSALIKAMLINGAVEIGAAGQSTMLTSLYPNTSQGWGRLLLDTALFFSQPSRESRGLRLWDKWNGEGLETGEEDSYSIYVSSSSEPLKVALTWTEPPPSPFSGIALCHDLDLEVSAPNGDIYRGNCFDLGSSYPNGGKDSLNNVEEVFVLNPSSGTWTIKIKAAYVPYIPNYEGSAKQGYAAAATFKDCGAPGLTVSSLTAADNGITGIALSWPAVSGASGYQIYRAKGNCSVPDDAFKFIAVSSINSYTDTSVQGGFAYGYKIRALDQCGEGPASSCATAVFSGNCAEPPVFSGIESAVQNSGSGCSIDLAWQAAVSGCPSSPSITYNIYRALSPYEKPSAASLIKKGVNAVSFTDYLVYPNVTYYYIVRAEDGTTLNGGPNNGGNEDGNEAVLFATAHSTSYSYGTFTDKGGDEGKASLALEGPWKVTRELNRTPGGQYCYHSAPDYLTYPNGACASAATEDIPLAPSSAPVLSYYVNYNLEDGFDGVVVEISTNGGAAWLPVTPGAGYPGTFGSTGSTPGNGCGYVSTQGAFSGPRGNADLSGWVQYSHDLTSYAGQTVRIKWVLSSDGGLGYEGLFLDDIVITNGSNYSDCSNSDGNILLNKTKFSCAETISVKLYDTDLTGAGSANVVAASVTEPSGEALSLAENPASSGKFEGTITTTSLPPASDGLLSVTDADVITVTYTDSSDGKGNFNVLKTANALAVCSPPDEIAKGLLFYDIQSFWQDKATQVWPEIPDASSYKLYRGTVADLPNLLNSGSETCVYNGVLPTFLCSENPALATGRLYWYLVTAVNTAGEGSAGNATSGPRIINPTSCP
jgi:hypothetical protein